MSGVLQQVIAIGMTGGLILVILELVRRKRLMERYALLWLASGIVLLVIAAWRGLLSTIAFAVGVHYPPALLFAVAFGVELLLLLHFSLAVSSLTDQNKILAQQLAILQQQVDEQARQTAAQADTNAGSESADLTRAPR